MFFLVKAVNKAKDLVSKEQEEEAAEEPVPTCPFCLEEVKEGATRCPHCGGTFEKPASAE